MNAERTNAEELIRKLRENAYEPHVEDWQIFEWMMQSADLIESLTAQLAASRRKERAAVNNMTAVLKRDSGDICKYCKHIIECKGQACDGYCSGAGDIDGNYPDWKWTCEDFVLGTCVKMENTPCNGCFENDYGGFEWRGQEAGKGEADG